MNVIEDSRGMQKLVEELGCKASQQDTDPYHTFVVLD